MNYTVEERFLRYVKIDTQADPLSDTFPSSDKQKDLTKVIINELEAMGVSCRTNEAGYVYASLSSNVPSQCPKVFFCAHLDTAPDCSGTGVQPIVHRNYQGGDIVLPDDTSQVISPAKYPELLNKKGNDIITASGLTLLGSDDKSGVAIIMDAFWQFVNNPDLPHGDVKMLLTTDEEVGKGTAKVDLSILDADFGYTLDSGDLGSFETENFSADAVTLEIFGVSAHPGYAKNKMENALKIAAEVIQSLPQLTLCPEMTEGKEGFIHPSKINGNLEKATIDFILRDFDTEKLSEYAALLESITQSVLTKYPGSAYKMNIRKQYRNMKDVLLKHPKVEKYALNAMKNLNIPIKSGSIRGGTDGATLSHMGLPCPNLFAGEQAIHSKHEWVSVQDMQKAVDTVIEICKLITLDNG